MAYNIFKRPGFRKGGVASLEPRQGYADAGIVQKIEDLQAKRREAYEAAAQPTAGEIALTLAEAIGRKPGGNIGEIASEAAKSFAPYFTKKRELQAKLPGLDIEDLLTVEKLKAYKDRYSATGGVTGFKLNQLDQILNEAQKTGKINERQRLRLSVLAGSKIPSNYQIRSDFLKAKKDDVIFQGLTSAEKEKIIQDYIKETNQSIVQGLIDQTVVEGQALKQSNNQGASTDALDTNIESLGKADGGRIGYAAGSMVQQQPAKASMTTDQGQQKDSRYTELRNRLPAEITDDVVQLIAYNNQAFQDFASIQSQADIDSFNRRYGVTLAIPMNT